MSENREELKLVELGEVSEETKGIYDFNALDSPPTTPPNNRKGDV